MNMSTKEIINRLAVVFLIAFTLSSCVKDEIEVDEIKYNIHPQFGVPIAHAHIAADRAIENFNDAGLIETDANGLIHIIYRDSLTELDAGDLLDIDNQAFSDTANLSALEYADLIGTGSVTLADDKIVPFETAEGDRLDSIRFESGELWLDVHTEGTFPIHGMIQIFAPDNTALITIDFSDDTPPIAIENTINLGGTLLEFTNDNSISNGLRIAYTFTLTNENGGPSEPVYIDVGIENFSIKSAGGYIAPRILSLDDQGAGIHLFDDFPQGTIRIEDPRVHFNVSNGFGIGLGIEVYSLYGIKPNGEVLSVDGSNINQLPAIAPATTIGVPALSTLSITNAFITPTLTDFFAFMPNYVSGSFGLAINPGNYQSVWISNESKVGINFEADIPIYGSIADFLLVDTTALTLGDLISDANDLAEVEEVEVRLIVDNGLPLDAGVQIIFIDSVFNEIDVLLDSETHIFTSAPVNTSGAKNDPNYGRAQGSTRTITDFKIPKSRIQNLEYASQMIIKVFGNTTGNGQHPIRLYDTDFFDVRLSAKATLNLNSDE